ncbi:transcription elongation factor SPT6-like [Ornithodoros turicata]
MADFVESEAEESDDEAVTGKNKIIDDDDEEEEEDDDERLREEMKDLINDEEEEVDDDSDNEVGKKKRRHHDDFDDNLEDEDYDLIEENLGVKVQRKKKFKRVRRIADEESDNEESKESMNRDAIANELFEGSDADGLEDGDKERGELEDEEAREASGSDLESDPDDFIVDDEGQPITKGKKKRTIKYNDVALQEAQDIFGVDFDFEEFAKYQDEYDEDMEEEEYEDEEEEGEARPRPKKTARKRPTKKSIFEVYEPVELERGHFTDRDNEIRATDIPERFQLRAVPMGSASEEEIAREAEWIYKQAFSNPTVSLQSSGAEEGSGGPAADAGGRHQPLAGRKNVTAVSKIAEALRFMRNQLFEVPFIAFYRKEYVEPDLNINDLWTVYKWDEKWCQLQTRKKNLQRLFTKMQEYQCDQILQDDLEKPLPENLRPIDDSDFQRLDEVQSSEELRDVYLHFLLYYAQDIPDMQEAQAAKRKKKKQEAAAAAAANPDEEGNPEKEADDNDDADDADETRLKHAVRKDMFAVCREAGLDGLARKFGLTPEQFGENLRDNYQRHEVDQFPVAPLEAAADFVSKRFTTPEEALKAARYMVATQISRDPVVRRCMRETFFERAKVCVSPTKKGLKEIDENHACYTMKYLRYKPVRNLEGEQFLNLSLAEKEGLVKLSIVMDSDTQSGTYLDEIKQLYYKDEFSSNVLEWNNQRSEALGYALNKFLYPTFEKELKIRLLGESQEGVIKACCRKLYNWLKVAPYSVDPQMEEDEDFDTRDGIRVFSIAYENNWEVPAFGALIDGTGEVSEYLRLPHLLKRKNAWKERERELKELDLKVLRKFIMNKKPHVICLGAVSREALQIIEDIKAVVTDLAENEQMPLIGVELVDNDLATVYMNSKKAENDFRDYPPLLRQAISLARRLQDPLVEFSQLCTPDEEIFCLKYHPLQDNVPRDELTNALSLEFVNRTNEVGVDINLAITHPHTSFLVQFICGLGPRKGYALLKVLKQSHQRLESRSQLVTVCNMGPKVFINCAGFIKIDTTSFENSTNAYVEVLDGSRVHPEAYEWARKMAVDALEYDDVTEDVNPAEALEEILENPEKLKDLDLDAFAVELERQGYGNKSITLYDIRAELNHRYKDLRTPFRPPSAEETFNMLTKETPQTFYIGKMVTCQVIGIARRKPRGPQLDQANPIRNDETGLWQCPFCLKNDFPELSEVWNHFDGGSCPGQAMGVRVRLDNGVSGFILTKFISDKKVTNPEERVQVGMILHCRITKIDIERFTVDLTCRSSDLADANNEWRPSKDLYYHYEGEEKDKKIHDDSKKKQNRQTYVKRVIVHPSFHNISYKEAEKLLSTMDQGEVIIRPSSRGVDHLTVTWKVYEGILQHIDVKEQGKENAFSLGSSLLINSEEFEDLDEIIARHVQPMAAYARDLVNFRYFRGAEGGKRDILEKLLSEEKKKNASKIHYFVSASKEFPGKFLLSYLPRVKARHEYVTVTPDGFRYRQQMFHSVGSLFRWFKEHFRDPIPGTPASTTNARTPMGQSSFIGATPSINISNVDPQTIQRAAANIPNHMFASLSQVAGQTPSFAGTYGASYTGPYPYHQQPYTPSQPVATPMVTPSYHAVATPSAVTPRYPQTPQATWAHPSQTPRGAHTPRHTPAAVQSNPIPTVVSSSKSASNPSAADWKRMAEQWAKQRREQDGPRTRTPRTPVHPSPSPMVESTPQGDATPLIDEQ